MYVTSAENSWKARLPPTFLAMSIQLHGGQLDRVRHSNILTRSFKITNGVKQGCVLVPTFFTLVFSMMLQQVTEDLVDKDSGVYIRFRTDGSLFNLRPLQAHTKTTEKLSCCSLLMLPMSPILSRSCSK